MKPVANWLIRFMFWFTMTLLLVSWQTKLYSVFNDEATMGYFLYAVAMSVALTRAWMRGVFVATRPLIWFYATPFILFCSVRAVNWIVGVIITENPMFLNVDLIPQVVFIVVYFLCFFAYFTWQLTENALNTSKREGNTYQPTVDNKSNHKHNGDVMWAIIALLVIVPLGIVLFSCLMISGWI